MCERPHCRYFLTSLNQYQNAFNISFNLSKAERMDLNDSYDYHTVVISGVHLDGSGKPVRYRVENSWGYKYGDDGYYVMTDEWFDE
jgi:bleomycin hydrolase